MKNIKYEVKGETLVITINLMEEMIPSKSGKSNLLATTRGNQSLEVEGRDLRLGLNLYEPTTSKSE